MSEPLFEVHVLPSGTDRPVLVHALSGFLDAGGARRLAVDHLLEHLEHKLVASYDIDALFDYRARRPRMVFDTDHFESVALPELILSELRDLDDVPFLLLHGPEPDLGWQRFTSSVVSLVEQFNVRLTVGMNAIPWPAPHTRPVAVTAHATSPHLVAGRRTWVGAIEVPGHLAGMLELKLGRMNQPAMGFAVHIPHYLVGVDHPRAALTLLEEVAAASALSLPLDALRERSDAADREINEQVASNPENIETLRSLEAQYDAAEAMAAGEGLPLLTDEPIPTGDELAAQLEQFLRDLDDRGDRGDRGPGPDDRGPGPDRLSS